MKENAGVAKCTVSGFLVVFANVWLIIKSVADCNMTRGPDRTLRSGEFVVRKLSFCFLDVLMIARGASIDFWILQVKSFYFAN